MDTSQTITHRVYVAPNSIGLILGSKYATLNRINDIHLGWAHTRLVSTSRGESPYFIVTGHPTHVVEISMALARIDMKAKLSKIWPKQKASNITFSSFKDTNLTDTCPKSPEDWLHIQDRIMRDPW
jgi:hypothetical protein